MRAGSSSFRSLVLIVSTVAALALACVSPSDPSYRTSTAMQPLVPSAGEVVELDHVMVIVDASASIPEGTLFVQQQATLESWVATMPDGSYQAGAIVFGGFDRQTVQLAPFDRSTVQARTADFRHLHEGTPLYKVFDETRAALSSRGGRAAVVVFTDGLPTDEFGREVEASRTLTAASDLAAAYQGTVCFHTVQVGSDAAGAVFLGDLSKVTECGSFRLGSALADDSGLYAFHRDVFIGERVAVRPTPPPVSAAAPSRCEGTPEGARLDARGCWDLPSIEFKFDSTDIDPSYLAELREVADVLEHNPDVRLRVDGRTDSTGNPAYNQDLSLRRANAARDALVDAGVSGEQIEVRPLGMEKPSFPNDTLENRGKNRRIDFVAIP